MSRETLIDLLYLFSATTFIVAFKGLGSPKRARYGNMVAAFGMLVAIVATFFKYVDGHPLHHVWLILLAMLIGVVIAVPTARFVQMTAMPQLVAIFNGVGGGAAESRVDHRVRAHQVDAPGDLHDPRGAPGCLDRYRVVLGIGHCLRQAPRAHDRAPDYLPGQQVINAIVGLGALGADRRRSSSADRRVSSGCCSPSPSCSVSPSCCPSVARTCRSSSRCSTPLPVSPSRPRALRSARTC